MKKTYKALGPNLIIRVNTQSVEKIGSIYIAPKNNADQAREEAEIVHLGEDAFIDLSEENRPKVGDMVVIPRYEGRVLIDNVEDVIKDSKKDFELRVVADNRVFCLIEIENTEEGTK